MGTIRFTRDGEHGLYGHEGHVSAEIDMEDPLGSGSRWIGWYGGELAGHFTGRYRAACDCGWHDPVVDAAARWPGCEARGGWLPEALHDQVMEAWDRHTDPLLAELELSGPLLELTHELRDLADRLGARVRAAIAAGVPPARLAAALPHRAASATIAVYCKES